MPILLVGKLAFGIVMGGESQTFFKVYVSLCALQTQS